MKVRRNSSGFTLLELMLAVAIIVVLSSMTAVNIIRRQRELTQVELDGIAREIFVAAQNHLTMAEGQGFMGVSDFGESYTETTETPEGAEQSKTYYYYVYPDLENNSNAPNMLDLMLPVASVDGLLSGSYVIRYQRDPALVLDVFYAYTSGKFQHSFTRTEVSEKEAENRAENKSESEKSEKYFFFSGNSDEQRNERQSYGDEKAVIGWYGIGAPNFVEKGATLYPPTIKLVNAEQLYVDVTNPNASEECEKAGLKLEITGLQSDKTCRITLIDKFGVINTNYSSDKSSFRVTLDDVTSADSHFWQVCCSDNPNLEDDSETLNAGENIRVCAVSYNNQELTNIATSASVMTNSLFASLDEEPDNPLHIVIHAAAKISNFRHLENLDSTVSHINPISALTGSGGSDYDYYQIPAPEGKKPVQIESVAQTGDMDWSEFASVIEAIHDGKVIVYSDKGNSADGFYLPIENQRRIVYTGAIKENVGTDHEKIRATKISNVKISVSGTDKHAGLFATLGNDSSVTDLELVNFSVTSEKGAAGALAGVLQGDSTVSGVLARHDSDKSGDDYKIQGKTSVGGLVGEITGARTVARSAVGQCAAAVYVVSESGDAGGLIGKIDNTEAVTLPVSISDSYAGGHTKNGSYKEDYNKKGYYNVKGRASAGGLIGSSEGELSVENCYATTSVEGATAGGLIGSADSGSITNCYATGYVTGSASGNAGAFAGKADETAVTFSEDGYFSAITGTLSAVGNRTEEDENVKELDDKLSAYGAGKADSAAPYDEFLKTAYKGLYTFKTISELPDGATSPDWMTKHYGDWPPLDTLVINQ